MQGPHAGDALFAVFPRLRHDGKVRPDPGTEQRFALWVCHALKVVRLLVENNIQQGFWNGLFIVNVERLVGFDYLPTASPEIDKQLRHGLVETDVIGVERADTLHPEKLLLAS